MSTEVSENGSVNGVEIEVPKALDKFPPKVKTKVVKANDLTPEQRRELALERPITISEKQRIETLIDQRSKQITEYLDSVQQEAVEAVSSLPFTDAEFLATTVEDIIKLKAEMSTLDEVKTSEVSSSLRVLSGDYSAVKQRIDQIRVRAEERYNERVAAAKEVVNAKFRDKEQKLTLEIRALEESVKALTTRASTEKKMREGALRNSFQQLTDDIRDQRNRAQEELWTSVATTGDTKEVLAMLPDTVAFRRKVTPTSLLQIFNSMVDLKALPAGAGICPHCKKEGRVVPCSNGRMKCESCYKFFAMDESIRNLVALPTLVDVLAQ